MSSQLLKALTIVLLCSLISGCAAVAVGGAATGAAVAYDRRTTGTVMEDQAIEVKASRAFNADTELSDDAHINVTSYNTKVLMAGEAPTEELRDRAIEIVRNIPKVSRVYNEVIIASPSSFMSRSSDSMITTKVKAALFGEAGIESTHVKVVTERGIVYLMGLLTAEEGERAVERTRRVGGVQKVVKLFETYEDS
ncbi:osmotically-inducible protein OsmY [Methylohalomonas lacus]|uniref:Osmotically-inducible protein OsmY n=1 Tax=Methylohalomonas lacus TaxID=398773 RepID=A0AAE3HHA7_9GAMM|nr:BON domain-containing protein [Methylohalomonas lacus]MCS3902239.1 osmotically-inducible protein OsmY [Methylohalomonas lacus]